MVAGTEPQYMSGGGRPVRSFTSLRSNLSISRYKLLRWRRIISNTTCTLVQPSLVKTIRTLRIPIKAMQRALTDSVNLRSNRLNSTISELYQVLTVLVSQVCWTFKSIIKAKTVAKMETCWTDVPLAPLIPHPAPSDTITHLITARFIVYSTVVVMCFSSFLHYLPWSQDTN